jgi:hypothetical protein
MKEKIVTFGKDNRCVGVVTEQDPKLEKNYVPALLVWNAGLLHRVGPYRLYVDLARKMASIGFLTFRFDLSGKGDSVSRRDNMCERDRSIQDVKDAMDYLVRKRDCERFVLLGLCSGADEAFPVGVQDSRVAGLILLDGFGYRTYGFYLHHYLPRMFKLYPWLNFFNSSLNSVLLRIQNGKNRESGRGDIFVREFPKKKQAKEELLSLVQRGARVLFIYSGGVKHAYYNYEGQFKDMFRNVDFGDKVEVEYFEEAAHTYTCLRDRDKLIAYTCEWMKKRFAV